MSSLNLSTNGASITKSYQSVVNAPAPAGPAASSPTYGQWAVYVVAAPLVSAFQQDGGKESVMKVQSTGEGELVDLIEEFSDGRIQFAFVKIKDPNTGLPKNVLIAWCGEGVPERTKGYFTSHLNAVTKTLHGYHVQITARSDRDLTPESILQKVADASGSKYTGGAAVSSSAAPPPVATKPVFLPTRVAGGAGFAPLGTRSRAFPTPSGPTDEDGWGQDAPQITRTQLEKVASAYQPTKVNIAELTSQKQESSRFSAPETERNPDVVRGAYQPIGKVDIAEIRRQAKSSGSGQDDRPTPVKGSYEPIGKVDIAAIRARAQAAPESQVSPVPTGASSREEESEEAPKSLADRSAAFQQSERLTSLPKPRVSNRFAGGSSFAGTKAPAPGEYAPKPSANEATVGIASRTFADKDGKTPAQLWAEKKARQGGGSVISPTGTGTAPVQAQKSGGWQSGYTGKSWAPVQTTRTGQSAVSNSSDRGAPVQEEESAEAAPSIGSIRDRFSHAPPPMDLTSKPNAGSRSVPPPPQEEEEEEYAPRSSSPIRVAMPIARQEEEEEPPVPIAAVSRAAAAARDVPPEPQVEEDDPARGAGIAVAESTFGAGAGQADPGAGKSGLTAIVEYDYEKAEDNEIDLVEGQVVTGIEQVDDDWWMGQNEQGHTGLFPSNYVKLVDEEEAPAPASAPAPAPVPAARESAPAPAAAPSASATASKLPTATAQYDYEAAEENELSFPDGAKILNLEFPDEDWWLGEYNGKTGLFPANYVQLDE